MNWTPFQNWLSLTPIWQVALCLLAAMVAAALGGVALRARHSRAKPKDDKAEGQEGYIVSAVLGLLALLMGFTFSLAVDRFDARRLLVLEESNAIGTAYLRAQLLPEPHRARTSDILVRYTDNRIKLAQAKPDSVGPYLAVNDALVTDLWAATSAAFEPIKGLDFSSAYIESINLVIDLDSSRKAARNARVPAEVFVVLIIYLVTTAGVMGYVLHGARGWMAAIFLLLLLALALSLIIDIDRPTLGGIVEGQGPMEALRKSMAGTPTQVYDKWKVPAAAAP